MKQPAHYTIRIRTRNAAPPQHEVACAGSWPDLPPELLLLILLRVPSHAGRVRCRAVCRSWRSAVQPGNLPPLFPWVALRDGAFLNVPDGKLHHLPIPADASHRVSTSDALFAAGSDASCFLTNPLARETTPQHTLWSEIGISTSNVHKVVVSDRAVVAAISISSGKVGICCSRGAPYIKCEVHADDIVLFQGKLYLLTSHHSPIRLHHKLHAMDYLGHAPTLQCIIPGTAEAPSTRKITYPIVTYKRYYYLVVVSGDRLLMVEREVEMQHVGNSVPSHTRRLEVFEATGLLDRLGHARWRKLDTLTGHALFISLDGSWSLPVANRNYYGSAAVGAVQEDCVYFLNEHKLDPRSNREVEDDFRNCGVYNVTDQTMSPLPREMASVLASHGGPLSLTWFFLPQI